MSEYESLREDIHGVADSLASYSLTVGRAVGAHDLEIRKLWADNAELRDELHAVSNRLENLTRARLTEPAEVAEKIVDGARLRSVPFKCPVPGCFIPDRHEHHADGHMIFRGTAS